MEDAEDPWGKGGKEGWGLWTWTGHELSFSTTVRLSRIDDLCVWLKVVIDRGERKDNDFVFYRVKEGFQLGRCPPDSDREGRKTLESKRGDR